MPYKDPAKAKLSALERSRRYKARKRAEKFIRKASLDGHFFMHNAARLDRAVVRKFWQIPLETVMPSAQATLSD